MDACVSISSTFPLFHLFPLFLTLLPPTLTPPHPHTGASSASVELLPAPGAGREWTAGLHSDEGHEGDLIYQFEGDTSGAVVPESVLPHNLTNTFTISTWMKHKAHPGMDKVRQGEAGFKQGQY